MICIDTTDILLYNTEPSNKYSVFSVPAIYIATITTLVILAFPLACINIKQYLPWY